MLKEGHSNGAGGSPWSQRVPVVTHILTYPTTAPSLYAQLFVASHLPDYTSWDDYPPILAAPSSSSPIPPLLHWSVAHFLRRASRLGLPHTSWRSKCPFQQPPPLVISTAVEPAPAKLGAEERREWRRRRLRRKRLGIQIPTVVGIAVPNLLLALTLFWDPLSLREEERSRRV